MKILLTMNLPYTRVHGGANKSNRSLVEELARRGHRVRVVVPALATPSRVTAEQVRAELIADGIEVRSIDGADLFKIDGVEVHSVAEPSQLRTQLLEQIRRFDPDWILVSSEDQSQNLLAAAIKERASRVVYLAHTPQMFPFGPYSLYPGRSRTELVGRAAAIVAISKFVAGYIRQWTGFEVFTNHPPHFGAGPYPYLANFDNSYVTLMNASAIKGLPIFLELAKSFPGVQFAALTGYGTTDADRTALDALPNVTILKNQKNLDDILKQTRILLMPSLWVEGFGMAVVDAMLRGVPVLASNFGGFTEAKLGTDYLIPVQPISEFKESLSDNMLPSPVVPPQDVTPWSDALKSLLTDRALYERQSQAARDASLKFVANLSVAPFERLLLQLLTNPRPVKKQEIVTAANDAKARSNGRPPERLQPQPQPTHPTSAPVSGLPKNVAELSPEQKAFLLLRLRQKNARRAPQGEGVAAIVPASRQRRLPLSFAQQRLWFIDQLEPGQSHFNLPAVIRLTGRLNIKALESTLNEVVRRHEVLRTHFPVGDDEQPMQIISPPSLMSLPVTDLSHISEAAREQEAQRLIGAEAERAFNLAEGPMLRASLLRLREEEHIALLTMHHIVSDGWSTGILIREVAALYEAYSEGRESPLPELEIQYGDFAVWQREYLQGEVLDEQLTYWRKQLAGAPAVLELPTDRPRPAVQSNRGDMYYARIPKELVEKLKGLGNYEGATLFMTLLAAFQMLLRHYTKQDRIVVGTDIANRHRSETEPLIGFFVNQLVLFTDLSDNPAFDKLLRRVRETTLEAYAHQDLPFEHLVEALRPERRLSHAPLFQVKMTLQNAPVGVLKMPGLALSAVESDVSVAAKVDLTLMLAEDPNGLGCYFEYSTDLFESSTISRMARLFEALLQNITDAPGATCNALEEKIVEIENKEQMLEKKRRAELNFLDILNTKPKPVSAQPKELVKKTSLRPGETFPLVITPLIAELDIVAWAESNRQLIEAELFKHGSILFRGFSVDMVSEFERFAQALSSSLHQDNGEHPRKSISGNVYTPVFYPSEQRVLWHNENSFNYQWPTKIWFGCFQPALRGGETPVADSRKVFEQMNPEIRAQFVEKGVTYVRNYGSGLGLHWQDVFRTTDKVEVEDACRKANMQFEWKDADMLKTSAVRPAVVAHPHTGEMSWFNQSQHWHISCLDAATHQSLLSLFCEEDLPRNCYYGDGSRIEDSVMEEILNVYRRLEVSFPWEKGDILMLDNILAAHARNQFEGERRIVVAMGDMLSYGEV
jgi:glycosyltransferase involved in cell wall biosynthesis/NRPS condensation-like uncharacterized protein/alpha-ketoglutarate-dependent taurine dioxygenase